MALGEVVLLSNVQVYSVAAGQHMTMPAMHLLIKLIAICVVQHFILEFVLTEGEMANDAGVVT